MENASIFSKRLNKNIPIPLYYQLKEILLDFIQNNPEYSLLPTEARICEHFEISRSTVRQAFSELSAEGLVLRHKGKGTMIAPVKKIEQEFLVVLESFNDEMQEKGLQPWTKVLELSLDEYDSKVAGALGLSKGVPAVKLRRLRGTGSEPMVLVTTWLPSGLNNLGTLINEDLVNESLYDLMGRKYGVEIASSRRILEIRKADPYEAELLGVAADSPLHHIETISSDAKGRRVEFSIAKYRADTSKFIIEVRNSRI